MARPQQGRVWGQATVGHCFVAGKTNRHPSGHGSAAPCVSIAWLEKCNKRSLFQAEHISWLQIQWRRENCLFSFTQSYITWIWGGQRWLNHNRSTHSLFTSDMTKWGDPFVTPCWISGAFDTIEASSFVLIWNNMYSFVLPHQDIRAACRQSSADVSAGVVYETSYPGAALCNP